jgi:hypothetical protein
MLLSPSEDAALLRKRVSRYSCSFGDGGLYSSLNVQQCEWHSREKAGMEFGSGAW